MNEEPLTLATAAFRERGASRARSAASLLSDSVHDIAALPLSSEGERSAEERAAASARGLVMDDELILKARRLAAIGAGQKSPA
jgi:hypothetical protein